jgi:hypothetical protein
VKIYVSALEAALEKNERQDETQDETQFITKIDGFFLTLCMTKLRFLVLCFSYFTGNSNTCWFLAKQTLGKLF